MTCLNTFSYVDQCCLHLFLVFFAVVDMSAIAQIACKCVLSFLVLSRSRQLLGKIRFGFVGGEGVYDANSPACKGSR